MARVKGTILIDFVKVIKSDKTGRFDKYLTAQDRKIISERILPSAWYPYETYKNCFAAVAAVVGNNNPQTIRQWGRLYGEAIISGVYKGLIKEGAPIQSLEKYATHIRNLFDFGDLLTVPLSALEAEMVMRGFDPDFEPQYHIMRGWLERSVEMCGVRDLKSDFNMKSWDGAPETRLSLSWRL
jgi:hypothetical protein